MVRVEVEEAVEELELDLVDEVVFEIVGGSKV